MDKLNVRAAGAALVADCAAMEHGIRRFIGRKFVQFADGRFGFEATGDVEIENLEPYRVALRQGDLEACDAKTAAAAGLHAFNNHQPAHSAQEQQ